MLSPHFVDWSNIPGAGFGLHRGPLFGKDLACCSQSVHRNPKSCQYSPSISSASVRVAKMCNQKHHAQYNTLNNTTAGYDGQCNEPIKERTSVDRLTSAKNTTIFGNMHTIAVVTILNAILLWLILGTEPGWSWLMTLQRYTPSFKASWKLPSGKGSPAIASSQLLASASICASYFASCCKEGEKCIKLLLKYRTHLKSDDRCCSGRKTLTYNYDTAPHTTTAHTHTHTRTQNLDFGSALLTFSLSSAVIPYPFGLSAMSVNLRYCS